MTFSKYLLAKARKMFHKVYVDENAGAYYIGHDEPDVTEGSRVRIYETDWEYDTPATAYNNRDLLRFIRMEENSPYRNALGELRYRLGNFEVVHSGDSFEITRVWVWHRSAAVFADELMTETPTFNSFIKAVAFLKKHAAELL